MTCIYFFFVFFFVVHSWWPIRWSVCPA